jgi:hypothetical protein
MAPELAAALIAGAFLLAGAGVLAAVGIAPRGPIAVLGWLCLAYVAGLAATMLVAIALVCAGVAVHAAVLGLASVAVGGAGIAVGLRRGWIRRRPARRGGEFRSLVRRVRGWGVEEWLTAGIAVVLAGYAALGYRWARGMPLGTWDAWSIWARKATILLDYGTVPTSFFGAHAYAFMHPDYPLLVPMLESIWFRFVGGADTQSLHVESWLLFVAALGAAAYLAARVTRPLVWAPLIAFVAIVPAVTGQLMTLYADVPMGLLLMLGALLVGLWLEERRGSLLALATLFLAAAANTKNEGLTSAVCVLGTAFVVSAAMPAAAGRRADLRALLLAVAAFAVAIAPWRLWLAVHHVGGDMPVGKGLDPAYLADRTNRISPTLKALYAQLTDQGSWSFVLPLGIGVVLACLLARTGRRLAAFYGLAGVAVFLSVVWAYVINPNDLSFQLPTSVNRTVDGLMFLAIAALLQLTGVLLRYAASTRSPSGRAASLSPAARRS